MLIIICLVVLGAGVARLTDANSRVAAQEGAASDDGVWQTLAESSFAVDETQVGAGQPDNAPVDSERDFRPKVYRTLRLNKGALTRLLAAAPLEFSAAARNDSAELTLPLPDNTFGRFRVVESPMLTADLAAQMPETKTYSAVGIDDPTATARFDLTIRGFHAIILSSAGTVLIAPGAERLTPGGAASTKLDEATEYISFFQADDPRASNAQCSVEALPGDETPAIKTRGARKPRADRPLIAQNGPRRTYRLAVAATAEYTAQNGGTVALARAAIVTSVNAVNAIFNREINVQMTLINNNSIIYTNATTDPYTSQNTNNLIAENQTNLDSVLGNANYDIGHVFDATNATGGAAGLATTPSTCVATTKARGTTGGGFLDLTAHEMGHQFGATHTFNDNSTGSCFSFNGANQREAASAYEPGSGSTLMSYGGTCGIKDLQPFRDNYFHIRSLEQIYAHISGGAAGDTCDVETATGNSGIIISQSSPAITVPDKTPFRLSAFFDDIDSDTQTVTWEEYDLGDPSPPEGDNGNRPLFRSYLPGAAQSRTFPRMDYILASNTNTPPATYRCGGTDAAPVMCLTGEARTETTRTMTFIGTARDNAGAVFSTTVTVNVRGGTGPFAITTPNASTPAWTQGAGVQIIWAGAGATAAAPINCLNVKISLSTDGGQTFPIVLEESTPNDGSEVITVPTVATNFARVKIESALDNFNSFFDISDTDFRIKRLAVTNTNDSGEGSLRQAILDANSDPNLTTIPFDIPGGGIHTIAPQSPLPQITSPVHLDGWTQIKDGNTKLPLIQLDGTNAGTTANGLTISGGGSTVRGLTINSFSASGIDLRGAGDNTIYSCYIGTNATGSAAKGNGGDGILINDSPDNSIGDASYPPNIISGNNVGVRITGSKATTNDVGNNFIGTDVNGNARVPNLFGGVQITGAPNNIIGKGVGGGGSPLGLGNLISGNGVNNFGADGIEISGAGASGNRIGNNIIGLNLNGAAALGNLGSGIYIDNAPNTQIGTENSSERNIISGNSGSGGITLIGSGSSGTVIKANYLGTDKTGTVAINNNANGIYVESSNNLIGGTTFSSGNVIAGFHETTNKSGKGIYLFYGAHGNTIQGNYIGTNANGTASLSNLATGIEVTGANNTVIGGTSAAARNLISGNASGININGNADNVRVQGNYIGTNPAGNSALPNRFTGVTVDNATNTSIGGTAAGAGNVISASGTGGNDHGIRLAYSTGAKVQGNRIGTNANGTAALGNGGAGIQVFQGNNNLIGGTTPAARNLISGNSNNGIYISANNVTVQGNYIGTDASGTLDLGNGKPTGAAGIENSGTNNTIGGTGAGAGNIIAFSGSTTCCGRPFGVGVRVFGTGHRIRGNSIFSNAEIGINLEGGNEGSSGFRVTANDSCDADTGANNLQNFPVLTAATSAGGSTVITGTLNSIASTAYSLDFFASPACDLSGNGEGRTHLGSATVNTDGSCNAPVNVTLPVGIASGGVITATATDAQGNTSEFSACRAVTNSGGNTTTLTPSADAWVQGADAFLNTNYGADTQLQVKRTLNPGSGRGRRGFLRFDTSALAGNITSARLRIFARLTDANLPPTGMIIQKVTDTLWDELGVTWNNQPVVASPNALAQITVAGAVGQYYEFDLTAFIQQERAANRSVVSFRLINQQPTGNSGVSFTAVNSREAATNQPQLVIQQ